jgi:hypothetical protein
MSDLAGGFGAQLLIHRWSHVGRRETFSDKALEKFF